MKLYVSAFAPNPRRVTMFIAEKQIADIEFVQVNLPEGEHKRPEFRAKSPLSQVPTLALDDGRTLTESRAICSYLETLYPDPNLMGVDAFERASIEMWDRRVEQLFAGPLMMWVRHGNPAIAAVEPNQNAEFAAYNERQAKRMAQWFDAELGKHEWLAGDRFTIADITAACAVDFARMMRWRPGDDLPNLRRWRLALAERPAGKVAA